MNPRRPENIASIPLTIPAGAPSWVTVELLEQTLNVWQPHYRDELTVNDALQILLDTAAIFRVVAFNDRSHKTATE